MKKLLAFLLAAAVLTSFAACGSDTKVEETTDEVETTAAPEGETTATTEGETTDAPETDAPETEAPETEAPETEAPETEAPEIEAPEVDEPVVVGSVADVVNNAIAKTNELKYISIDINVDMSISSMGMEFDMPMQMQLKADKSNPDNIITDTVTKADFLGMTTETREYTEGNWSYITEDGSSYKMEVEDTETTTDMTETLPASVFDGKSFTQNADGSLTVEIVVPESEYDSVFGGLVSELASNDGTVRNVTLKITVNNGYLTVYYIYMEISTEEDGTTATTTMAIDAKYNNPGEAFTITPPEGYQDFEEYSYELDFEGLE